MERIDWAALEVPVRRAVEKRTGQVREARAATEGKQSHLAVLLDTDGGLVFLKGIRDGDHGTVRQRREAMINPVVAPVAPCLLWQAQVAGWDLLAFEAIPQARHPDYRPDSPDLPRIVQVMNRLSQISCPDLPVKQARQRWVGYLDDPTMAYLFDGDRLLHSDSSPDNILITPDREWIIDWAWPTRGAGWIDPACWAFRLVAAGHDPASAESWAARCDGWSTAAPAAVDVFAAANARVFTEIAEQNPAPWTQALRTAALTWRDHRTASAARHLA